ncbi:IDEAL domain-containing protein [[Brevibacterium] frigoritolerans]|uniref:IDEAL domain-containing protein n=1 Tax=Peribacillus frigoritolerans TaxID=450367 RepID=A0A941FIS7_9BACI|nr:IDEAL domain-containing protein [Peribacillus frigoritolerans]
MEKNLANTPPQPEINVKDSEFAEMVLNKALLNFRKEQIRKEIDQSLQGYNKEEFLRLTEELKNISFKFDNLILPEWKMRIINLAKSKAFL